MRRRTWLAGFMGLLLFWTTAGQLTAQAPQDNAFLKDYSKGPNWFGHFTAPYRQQPIPSLSLENSPRLHDLIHDGKLQISMADALALAIENNLDIAVERQIVPMAQTDVLRSASGSAARGFSGATIPLGLSAGALGAGVSTAVAGGGVGNAGGISGGGGAVNIAPVGTFDPTINYAFSWDRTASPLNSLVVAGVPSVTTYSTSYSGSYTQLLPTGTSYFVSLNGLRSSSTQQSLLLNPDVATRMSVGFNQPLLSGLGLKPNLRFLLVARNNENVSGAIFRTQLQATMLQVENAYWDIGAVPGQRQSRARNPWRRRKDFMRTARGKRQWELWRRWTWSRRNPRWPAAERDLVVAQNQLSNPRNHVEEPLEQTSGSRTGSGGDRDHRPAAGAKRQRYSAASRRAGRSFSQPPGPASCADELAERADLHPIHGQQPAADGQRLRPICGIGFARQLHSLRQGDLQSARRRGAGHDCTGGGLGIAAADGCKPLSRKSLWGSV